MDDGSQQVEAALRSALVNAPGADVADRLSSLVVRGAAATLILDGAGLTAAERDSLEAEARAQAGAHPGIDEVRVAVMAQRTARRIIAVGSGKGGVGKSTLTANLAVALKRRGHKVGVVDGDIYGPSQPTLLKSSGAKPVAKGDKLQPVTGVLDIPMLSIGHIVAPGKALAWRGPMAAGALGQLIEADWGDVETLLVDLPPGTGDVQLTMVQKFKPAGAVIVSTPQDLALIDAARAGQLFETAGVPVIGLVENMAGYQCPHCGETSDPFGQGGVEAIAERLELPFMGRVPLTLDIRKASDAGTPPAAGDSDAGAAFMPIADRLADWLRQEAR